MNTSEISTAYGAIIGKVASDEGFKAQLMSDPRGALASMGYGLPEGVSVKVVESTPSELTLALPPSAPKGKLSDAQLDQVSGGKIYETSGKGHPGQKGSIWG